MEGDGEAAVATPTASPRSLDISATFSGVDANTSAARQHRPTIRPLP
jgi:hypothetical protein